MSRLNEIQPNETSETVQTLFDTVKKSLGKVPNMYKGIANSPMALGAYVAINAAVKTGALSGKEREVIALVLAQFNDCTYCLSAHTLGAKAQGIPVEETLKLRTGESSDPKLQALAHFVLAILEGKGEVSDQDATDIRAAGYTDEQLVEVVLSIGLNFFTNLFNRFNGTTLDFPLAPSK